VSDPGAGAVDPAQPGGVDPRIPFGVRGSTLYAGRQQLMTLLFA